MIDTRAHFTAIVVSLTLALFGAGYLLFHVPLTDEAPPEADGAHTATSEPGADAGTSSS